MKGVLKILKLNRIYRKFYFCSLMNKKILRFTYPFIHLKRDDISNLLWFCKNHSSELSELGFRVFYKETQGLKIVGVFSKKVIILGSWE